MAEKAEAKILDIRTRLSEGRKVYNAIVDERNALVIELSAVYSTEELAKLFGMKIANVEKVLESKPQGYF